MAAKTDPAVEDIDSDDENDEEPCLKYQHLTGEDSRISKHTSVTCIHVHLDQFVVLGTADAEIIIVSDGKERCRFGWGGGGGKNKSTILSSMDCK